MTLTPVDVLLEGWDTLKVVRLVKALREATGMGLKDAFDHICNFSENGPDAVMGCFCFDLETARVFAQAAHQAGVKAVRVGGVSWP